MPVGIVVAAIADDDAAGPGAVNAIAALPGFAGMEAVMVMEGPEMPDAKADARQGLTLFCIGSAAGAAGATGAGVLWLKRWAGASG